MEQRINRERRQESRGSGLRQPRLEIVQASSMEVALKNVGKKIQETFL